MPSEKGHLYCMDTGGLIDTWHFWYHQQSHPTYWEELEQLAIQGRLFYPQQVHEELEYKDDDLIAWCKERRKFLISSPTDETEETFAELVNRYQIEAGTVGTGRNYADLYVVATALVRGAVVVTTETPSKEMKKGREKVPDICKLENLRCIQPYHMVRDEGWVFRHDGK